METKINYKPEDYLISVAEKAESCNFNKKTIELDEIKPNLEFLSEYYSISVSEAFWMSILYLFSFNKSGVEMPEMARYMSSSSLKIGAFKNDFLSLENKKIITKINKQRRGEFANEYSYAIPIEVIEKISKGDRLTSAVEVKKKENTVDFLSQANDIAMNIKSKNISLANGLLQITELINNNRKLILVKKVEKDNLIVEDKLLLFLCIWDLISGEEDLKLFDFIKLVYQSKSEQINAIQNFINKKNALIKKNWLVLNHIDSYVFSTIVNLSPKTIELLEKQDIKLFLNSEITQVEGVIKHGKIAAKTLLFSAGETNQFNTISNALQETEFNKIQKRLLEKKLAIGVTVLFHGDPGTGKTESVLQIARTTKRDIVKLDLSNTKSMWYGESQKKVKEIFNNYYKIKKANKITPILFINECDSLFASRKSSNESSSIANTENEMINILLDELENFDGILFATTNLPENQDDAFSRRFLFKMNFKKPDQLIRAKIFQLKLDSLPSNYCHQLALNYQLSGGEIDNIARKIEINSILNGTVPTYEMVSAYCDEEKRIKPYKFVKIKGFMAS
jgi:hypothetical protein